MTRSRLLFSAALGIVVLLGIVFSRQTRFGIAPTPPFSARSAGNHDGHSLDNDSTSTSDLRHEDWPERLAKLAQSDLAGTIALLQTLPEGDRQRDLTRQLLDDLFKENPLAAAEFVAQLPSPLDSQMASALASLWGAKDTAAAVTWVRKLPPGPVRSQAAFSLCADWAAAAPQVVAEWVVNSTDSDFPLGPENNPMPNPENPPPNRLRSQMLEIIAARWAVNDLRAATAWVTQLPPGDSRDSLAAGLSSVLAESSPTEAASLVASMAPGDRQEDAALSVLLQWGRADLPAAAQWLELFPTGSFRDKALLNLTANSADQPTESATTFLLNWPEPAERTQAIRHYLTVTLDAHPAQGVDLLAGIDDDSLLQEETERLAQHWIMLDPFAAEQWLARTDFDASTKSRLLTNPSLP